MNIALKRLGLSILVISCLIFSATSPALADNKKVVLQISDDSLSKQTLVLNVADNLKSAYGDKIDLEIVAFGPGLKMMLKGRENSKRLTSLSKNNVRLSACRNTGMKMAKMLDKEIQIEQGVDYVDGGAGRIVELVEQGYVLIRP